MYQILPFLEEASVKETLIRTQQLSKFPIVLYNCPSRRGITIHQNSQISLVDYAATVGGPSRSEIGDTEFQKYLADQHPTYTQFVSNQEDVFWGCPGCTTGTGRGLGELETRFKAGKQPKIRGVIQRSDWTGMPDDPAPLYRHIGFMTKMTPAKITDGTSKTMMVSEKWVHTAKSQGSGGQADDRGWTDGWDFDAQRSTLIRPRADGEVPEPSDANPNDPGNYPLGSAHAGGINVAFADGSVGAVTYEVNLETLNQLGNRYDGEVIDEEF
jgi:prepilin-type processing-associated H-X9-DG protein